MFNKLSNLLHSKLSRKDDFSKQLEIVKVFDIYKTELTKNLPRESAHPISLKNGILTVAVKSSVQANELRFWEKVFMDKINTALGKEAVKRIIYRF